MTPTQPGPCEKVADLLGVYVLDALDEDEAALVHDHVQVCPRCTQEVDEHRETIALLASAGGPAPGRVWDRIAESIGGGSRTAASPAPSLRAPARRRTRRYQAIWASGLAAAAAVAVVLGLQASRVDQLNHRVDQLSAAARQTGGFQGLAAALVDPSARHYTLASTAAGTQPLGQLIVLPSGASYLVGGRLPQLPPASTYQLWSLVDGRAVSVGLLGEHPSTVAFAVDPTVTTTAYLVTVEPAGGVVAPTGPPVAEAVV